MQETKGLMPGSEDPLETKWQPSSSILGNPHGQRSKELNTTEAEHNLEAKQQQYFFVHKDKIFNSQLKHKPPALLIKLLETPPRSE